MGTHLTNVVAFPSTTSLNNTVRQHYQLVQKFVMSNIQLMDKSDIKTSTKEVFLDFEDPGSPKVVIDIKRSDKAVKRAEQIRKDNPQVARPNVLFVMIDSLSRQHFYRKMPQTAEYLEQLYKPGNQLRAYQFFRYHSLANHAEPNLIALRYDEAKLEIASNKSKWIKAD